LPRFDSDAVFAALLGDPSNGTGNVPQTLSHASLVNARFRTRRWSTRQRAWQGVTQSSREVPRGRFSQPRMRRSGALSIALTLLAGGGG